MERNFAETIQSPKELEDRGPKSGQYEVGSPDAPQSEKKNVIPPEAEDDIEAYIAQAEIDENPVVSVGQQEIADLLKSRREGKDGTRLLLERIVGQTLDSMSDSLTWDASWRGRTITRVASRLASLDINATPAVFMSEMRASLRKEVDSRKSNG